MTTPTIFSDAANNGIGRRRGALDGSQFVTTGLVTVPAGTDGDTVIGMIPVREGDRLISLAVRSEDLDTGTAITADVGWVYTNTSLSTSEDLDGFIDGDAVVQSLGNVVYPGGSNDGTAFNYQFEGEGFIAITLRDSGSGGTTTEGTIELVATMDYGAKTTG